MSGLKPYSFCGQSPRMSKSLGGEAWWIDCRCGAVPPPGSADAMSLGCTCPVYDNAHGAGRGKDEHGRVVYVMSLDCPLHGGKKG